MKQKTSGSGLIFAVVLLFVILGMVITLSSVTMLETKMNQKTKSSVGAFYNSESGVEWALNQIATKNSTAQISTLGSCPFTGCSVLFLDKDGKVLATSATIDQVKAVRSVGNQGGETQRAIEAAVASGGQACFTYYCGGAGASQPCVNHVSGQGYCPTGFSQIYAMGSWGGCGSGAGFSPSFFRPPGSGCPNGWNSCGINGCGVDSNGVGDAYICCKN